jgi:hypothetical protein
VGYFNIRGWGVIADVIRSLSHDPEGPVARSGVERDMSDDRTAGRLAREGHVGSGQIPPVAAEAASSKPPASGLRVESVADGLRMSANSDSRLVLLVSHSPRALGPAAQAASAELGWRAVDLNTALAERLLPLTPGERQSEAWDALSELVGQHQAGVVLLSTDVLFEATLGFRPYETLRRIGRQGPVVATWFGTVEAGEVIRASPGHPEFVRVRLDVPYVQVVDEKGLQS